MGVEENTESMLAKFSQRPPVDLLGGSQLIGKTFRQK
jgi:hypothetical protein